MVTQNVPAASADWRRVGAMSTSLSLHGVAVVLATLAIAAPAALPDSRLQPDNAIIAEIVEPSPIEPPAPQLRTATPARSADPAVPPAQPMTRDVATPTRAVAVAMSSPDESIDEQILPSIVIDDASIEQPTTQSAVAYDEVRPPSYPPMARRKGLQGETVLRVLVGTTGQPLHIEIGRSSGYRDLDRAAIASVRRWRFRAAMESGVAIETWVEVPINFRLHRQ